MLRTAWILAIVPAAAQDAPYFPPRGEWATREADAAGMSQERLDAAVAFVKDHDNPGSRDLKTYIARALGNEPHGEAIGPIQPRGAINGLIVRRGYVVAEWGDTRRADMTFSVTKTYLSSVVGLAFDRGMIRDIGDKVRAYVPPGNFDSEHNAKITWDHLLRQTSDWKGALWGKPDWADRPPRGVPVEELPNLPRKEPGTFYEYNDVRVNLLALCALHVWRRPLPQVLREHVMDPIGASNTWRWHGYASSWVTIDGLKMQSVSGGGHWGGGMFISSRDHARFGYLFLRNGKWNAKRIVSEKWIAMARTPGTANKTYGFMNWFLNVPRRDGGRRPIPKAPASAVTFRGAGSNVIYVDWQNDLVVVVRWIDRSLARFVGMVIDAIEET